ncbi:MAG TPA: hypothetical protein VNB29_06835 [Chthoniobacterales bacterium]|nr:hypothetical protein [Chthoniobacterales bacterium]
MAPDSKADSTIVLLIMGISSLIGSIPFFLIHRPFLVSHQSYKNSTWGNEIIDHRTGIIYGLFLVVGGVFFLYLYIRLKRNLPEDAQRSPH